MIQQEAGQQAAAQQEPAPQTPMSARPAGQAVIEVLLRHQDETPARTRFGRVFGYSPLGAESVSWYLGAKGEIAVARVLATLPAGWTVFHALPIGKKGADIDHLLIGPGGVFTINTKNHAGKGVWVAGQTVMVSGHRVSHIRSAEYEADRVTKLLRQRMPHLAAAHPVVAVVNPKSLTIKKKPDLVAVLAATGLRRWILTRPVRLGPAELARLQQIIDDPATWPAPLFPPTENAPRLFAALDAEVRAALVRRTAWKLAGIAVLAGGLLLAAPSLTDVLIGLTTGG
ncbi:nuclease-related domain-containing protein [Cryobacterium sp. PH31-AA6]|uniref:nuclease-related domain-containing protein n=1 Tax=Cryobacterium sp. PH31-AA6 TaxID=3046205 RepID=UPI0024BA4F62|nr:nuclease-related domain-containing protein [Cryobacterium sp. PH31-AA6]MDJ0324777.1 nuclease-related domain-containing protein [Cryobacterium sp. PH31-AA6]